MKKLIELYKRYRDRKLRERCVKYASMRKDSKTPLYYESEAVYRFISLMKKLIELYKRYRDRKLRERCVKYASMRKDSKTPLYYESEAVYRFIIGEER